MCLVLENQLIKRQIRRQCWMLTEEIKKCVLNLELIISWFTNTAGL